MENSMEIGPILIVDDDEVVLDVATLMVKKLGYNVLQAKSGKEAAQVFRDSVEAICMVILDMKLPDESGSDICKKFKDIKPSVRILHTSGIGKGLGNEVLECGCNSCLLKPFHFEELSNKLKELLENKGQ
jgi:DNA-binding response OmpR family regulator